jgi:hypothetical protein
VSEGLIAEAGNLDAMIAVSLRESELPEGLGTVVWGLAELNYVTGLASTASLAAAANRLGEAGDVLGEANCFFRLGLIAYNRSDFNEARQRYEAALLRYQKFGRVLRRGQLHAGPRRHPLF